MKISIVTAYYNRKQLFINTLKSFEKLGYKDVEIIVVDDASNEDQRLNDLLDKFNLNLRVFRVEPKNKWWVNPCIPFNMGFNKASGDVIILQNPECLHNGDIVKAVKENIQENRYLVMGCYSVDNNITQKLTEGIDVNELIHPTVNRGIHYDGETAWYQHSVHRPHNLHFCSAIMKSDLDKLGGFDERYANGIGFDDNDFLFRVQKMGMELKLIDEPFAIHQYHGATNYRHNWDLVTKNNILFVNAQKGL
jgi:GT2 family glycosyltransferase